MSITSDLADFVADLTYDDLPPTVVAKAKELICHSWGVQVAGSTLPWSRMNYRFARAQGGLPQSTTVGYGMRTSMATAALVNSSFAHSFESDDNHARTGLKGGAVAVPTAVAVGEQQVRGGREVITAVVLGFEIMARAGLAILPGNGSRRTHLTGAVGGLGAAAITCKLLDIAGPTLGNALSIGAAHRFGFQEIPASGRGHIKRTFPAFAAAHGVRAALLAGEGMSAPTTTLDAGSGLSRAYDLHDDRETVFTDGLGDTWEILEVHYKIWSQDGHIQPMTECLEAILAQRPIGVDEIESVRIGTHRRAIEQVVGVIRDPRDVTDAQFSATFSVALYLSTGGAGFDEYNESNLKRQDIRDLASRVSLEVDDEIEKEYQRTRPRGARVTIRLRSGEELTHYVRNLRTMSADDLDDKFRRLAGRVLPADQVEDVLASAHSLEDVTDIGPVVRTLVRAGST